MSNEAAGQVREGSAGETPASPAACYAIGDIHGYLEDLDAALTAAGLIGTDGAWSGGEAAVWFLGDFSDRGPDGIGVIDRIRGLAVEAEAAGGKVDALLGNHELLLLGAHRYEDQPVPTTYPERVFRKVWILNGGQDSDLDRMTDEHVAWLSSRGVVARVGEHLLMHSDTTSYLSYGDSAAEINAAVADVLAGDDIDDWWVCNRRLTGRHEFRGAHGEQTANEVLKRLGGRQIVHGHSTIPAHLGIDPAEVEGPHEYAGGKALAIDGGVYLGGPCLVVRLDDRRPAHAAGRSPARRDA